MVSQETNLLLAQLNSLSLGVNPLTGTAFLKDSNMHSPEIIRSLILVREALLSDCERKESEKRIKKLNTKKFSPEINLPARHGMKWTEEETIQVMEAFQTDIHPKDIAKIHKRKVTAIIAKLESKGLIDPDERESYL